MNPHKFGRALIDFGSAFKLKLVKDAALTLDMSLTDFVRYSITHVLNDYPRIAADIIRLRALETFTTKIQGELHRKFECADFGDPRVQEKLARITLTQDDWTASRRKNNWVKINPCSTESNKIFASSTLDICDLEEVSKDGGSVPPALPRDKIKRLFEVRKVILEFLTRRVTLAEKQECDLGSEVVEQLFRIHFWREFELIKVSYQAIPGLRLAAQKFGIPERIDDRAWNDPYTLLQYVEWREFPGNAEAGYEPEVAELTCSNINSASFRRFITRGKSSA